MAFKLDVHHPAARGGGGGAQRRRDNLDAVVAGGAFGDGACSLVRGVDSRSPTRASPRGRSGPRAGAEAVGDGGIESCVTRSGRAGAARPSHHQTVPDPRPQRHERVIFARVLEALAVDVAVVQLPSNIVDVREELKWTPTTSSCKAAQATGTKMNVSNQYTPSSKEWNATP